MCTLYLQIMRLGLPCFITILTPTRPPTLSMGLAYCQKPLWIDYYLVLGGEEPREPVVKPQNMLGTVLYYLPTKIKSVSCTPCARYDLAMLLFSALNYLTI